MRARPTKILTQHIMNMCDPRPSLSARLTTHLTFRFVLVMRFWSTVDQTAMFMLVIVRDSFVCDTSELILPVACSGALEESCTEFQFSGMLRGLVGDENSITKGTVT